MKLAKRFGMMRGLLANRRTGESGREDGALPEFGQLTG